MGAEVRPDSAEPMRGTGEPVCENRSASVVCRGRRGGTAGASSRGTQDVVGSTSMREPSSGRNHCVDGSDPCDRIRTVSARNDGGHGEGGAEAVARTREGKEENFSEGLSL